MDGLGGVLGLVIYRQRVQEAEARARLGWGLDTEPDGGESSQGFLAELKRSIASYARRFSHDAGRQVGRNIRHERGDRATA